MAWFAAGWSLVCESFSLVCSRLVSLKQGEFTLFVCRTQSGTPALLPTLNLASSNRSFCWHRSSVSLLSQADHSGHIAEYMNPTTSNHMHPCWGRSSASPSPARRAPRSPLCTTRSAAPWMLRSRLWTGRWSKSRMAPSSSCR